MELSFVYRVVYKVFKKREEKKEGRRVVGTSDFYFSILEHIIHLCIHLSWLTMIVDTIDMVYY